MPGAAIMCGLALACSGARDERPIGGLEPPPPTTIAQAEGYDRAVQLGAAWAQHQGYQAELVEAQLGAPHQWLSRFGVVRHDGRRTVVRLTVDAAAAQVTPIEEEPLPIARPPSGQ